MLSSGHDAMKCKVRSTIVVSPGQEDAINAHPSHAATSARSSERFHSPNETAISIEHGVAPAGPRNLIILDPDRVTRRWSNCVVERQELALNGSRHIAPTPHQAFAPRGTYSPEPRSPPHDLNELAKSAVYPILGGVAVTDVHSIPGCGDVGAHSYHPIKALGGQQSKRGYRGSIPAYSINLGDLFVIGFPRGDGRPPDEYCSIAQAGICTHPSIREVRR
jgi:hypothetical protein